MILVKCEVFEAKDVVPSNSFELIKPTEYFESDYGFGYPGFF